MRKKTTVKYTRKIIRTKRNGLMKGPTRFSIYPGVRFPKTLLIGSRGRARARGSRKVPE